MAGVLYIKACMNGSSATTFHSVSRKKARERERDRERVWHCPMRMADTPENEGPGRGVEIEEAEKSGP